MEREKHNNKSTVGKTHTQVIHQHKWSHPVTPCDARSWGIQWSHVTQGHMTWGKEMEMEIVSLSRYVKLKTPSWSPDSGTGAAALGWVSVGGIQVDA